MSDKRLTVWGDPVNVKPEKTEARKLKLAKAGFTDNEIEVMKHMRLYTHEIMDFDGAERMSTAAYNLYRRRKNARDKLAKKLGISKDKAAEKMREEGHEEIDQHYARGFTWLPAEYDPLVQMKYKKPTLGVM